MLEQTASVYRTIRTLRMSTRTHTHTHTHKTFHGYELVYKICIPYCFIGMIQIYSS